MCVKAGSKIKNPPIRIPVFSKMKPLENLPPISLSSPQMNNNQTENNQNLDLLDQIQIQQEEIQNLKIQLENERMKNSQLQNQIDEMSDFLNDYGLSWKGGDRPNFTNFQKGPDSNLFQSKILELNGIAEQNRDHLAKDGNIAQMVSADPLPLILYDDGFILGDSELRIYTKPINASFIQDILDGYFPSELKNDYPNGIKFDLTDKRSKFNGKGRSVSDFSKSSPMNFEPLSPPSDIGSGDGQIKVRFPDLPEALIKISPSLTVLEFKSLLSSYFDLSDFDLHVPLSTEALKDDQTMLECSLYPRGIVFVQLIAHPYQS